MTAVRVAPDKRQAGPASRSAVDRHERQQLLYAAVDVDTLGYMLPDLKPETMAFGRPMRQHWSLDPAVTYLNHGTVGVVPTRVLAAQQAIRDQIERQPAAFLLRELWNFPGSSRSTPTLLREAAALVAAFVGGRGEDLVFVDNATTGINAVLRSLPLTPGDELILTDQAYGAIANTAAFVARARGALVCTIPVPYPHFDPDALVDRIAEAVGPHTRLVIVDHIAAESALVFPVAAIAERCHARGVPVLVDGAHAPGGIALDVAAIGADYYVANLHKWACAPRSCGFLWAAPARQTDLHPTVISWGLDEGFTREFDWVGTRDPSPFLAAPEGIAFLRELGLDAVLAHNHDLAWRAGQFLADRWGTTLGFGETSVGAMVTVPAPASLGSTRAEAVRLRDALLFEDGIEVQVHAHVGRVWVRVAAQVYNNWTDVEHLAQAVADRAAPTS